MGKTKDDLIRERSKERLKKEAKKRIQTTMIGSLSSIEKYFSEHLGSYDTQRTPEQDKMRELYEELRTEILDRGNNQIRIIESEIDTYDVRWNKYHMDLPLSPFTGKNRKGT